MTRQVPPQHSPSEEEVIHFSRRKTVLYAMVSTLLGLLVIEGISAVIWSTLVPDRHQAQMDVVPIHFGMVNYPDVVEKDPWLFWQLKANSTAPLDRGKMTGFIANSDHMRNPEVPVERRPGDFRVLCLGDSITFGWGVRYEEAYPTLLSEKLREALPGREVQVLNASCSGYTAYQGAEMLRRRGLKYRPDVVVIWFGWNDQSVWNGMSDAEIARLFVREHLLTYSATYRVLSYMLRRNKYNEIQEERKEKGTGLPRMPLADYRARLEEMVELARADEVSAGRGARVVFIQGCFRDQLRSARKHKGRFRRDDYQNAMAEVAEQLEVPMLPVCDAFYQAGLRREDFLDPGHPNPRAQRVVAEALFALLAEHHMLPDPVPAATAQTTRP